MNYSTRRKFLTVSLGTTAWLAFGSRVPGYLAQAAATARARETVLVVIQLTGGNDGLNTVVPVTDDEYQRRRPTLRLPAQQLHKINGQLGFHPEMTAFHRLYQEGCLSVLQGVGYPKSSRNHDAALRDWATAQPHASTCQTGCLGRAFDQACQGGETDLPGVFVGSIRMPFGLRAEKAVVPSMSSLREWGIEAKAARRDRQLAEVISGAPAEPDQPLLELLRRATAEASAAQQRVAAVIEAQAGASATAYPPFQLAQTLRTIAQLVRAELGVRIYCAELGGGGIGGFDTHANQAANHGALLRQLSESVGAFVADLRRDKLLDRVLVMTFSEFGRTVAENGRRGTDHGAAAPVFLVGGRLKGGLVGAHPSLKDLEQGALKFHTDFRRVYATALETWLGFDSQAILGASFPPLDVLGA